jgi:3-hydroxy-9,10-secoandrosta-1,3,5(10)-triene-9,17-dione monooxygenase
VSTTAPGGAASITAPEPELTPREMVERAVALRPILIERQAETEKLTYPPQSTHEEFLEAGFYRIYVPPRYGGYGFGLPDYVRVISEVARGCVNSAWCLGLAANHALQIGSWFEERAQAEIFGDGDFRCASVAQPVGTATPEDGGWRLDGQVAYASGLPYSTHYMGQAFTPGEAPDGPPGPILLFVAPRSQWTMVDDWGNTLGLKGSGSHSVRFEGGHIPAHWALERTFMIDVDLGADSPGVRLHGNPMYGGRALAPFTVSLAALMVGAARNALDALEEDLRAKRSLNPPFIPRAEDPDFQRWFGAALGRIALAEAATLRAAEEHMELCARAVEEGIPYSWADDMRVGVIAREAYILAWETMERDIFRAAGSSAARNGQRIERIFRDMAMIAGHRNTVMRDWAFRELARAQLGLPRDFNPMT